MNIQGFYTGREFDADTFFGAHPYEGGTHFAVWAPSARDVKVITSGLSDGSWAEWQMHRSYSGCWEADAAGVTRGTCYQYRVCGADGSVVDHCDPYGTAMTLRPDGRSIVWGAPTCQWTDSAWMAKRSKNFDAPLNIYEAQAGSWRCKEDGTPYTYSELAKQLPAYLKENGYTHLELMPLSEYPFDGSWGYQTTGFFAPTSRYGTPDELCTLIDACHAADIGVIFDFVPVHFAVDEYGLKHFDGTALYEYPAAAVGESEWGSCNFMHSRGEVRSFLQSAAHYWLEEFHFDGLRMDAVRNLLYWQGDEARGTNQGGIQFLRELNRGLKERHPTAMLIAEDSSTYPGVTRPADQGGLGFDYKWDMGWMHDTLSYFQSDPWERSQKYHQLTFSMQYFYNERYLLPFSHDEVVHGKATILQKMNGDYEKKFPQARALYLYMFLHPGKKLNFMGSEFGQLREWDESREQDWDVLRYPIHDGFYHFFQALNRLYLEHPALWAEDYQGDGFVWLDCHQEGRCLYALERRSGSERLAAVFNFSDQYQADYTLKIPHAQGLTLLLDSDSAPFGGGTQQPQNYISVTDGQVTLTLPPFSGRLYQIQ